MNLYPVNVYCCKVSQLLIKETLQCAAQIMLFKLTSTVPSPGSFAVAQKLFSEGIETFLVAVSDWYIGV